MDSEKLKHLLPERYRIDREIGHGGMAVVYLAHDRDLDRYVALKVLRPELAASLHAERFLREIQVVARLNHPNILSIHDSGHTGGQDGRSEEFLYWVMPYVEGESLRARLKREKQLPIDEALSIAAQVAGALNHAHENGVVHRDIKPENILLQGQQAVVADSGIAWAVTVTGHERSTETGLTGGTVSYMSPEQSAGHRDVDGRSDIYSLGCVLHEMIGGEPPFTGPTAEAIRARHARDPAPPVSTIRPATPPGVAAVILRSLSKDPGNRYQTAEHLRAALSDPKTTTPESPARAKRTTAPRWRRVVLGVVGVAALSFGAWRLLGNTSPPPLAGVVVVLPFEVEGDFDRPLDQASIAQLLRSYFGYIERYRSVRGELVDQALADQCSTGLIERSCGSAVAKQVGAQFHVTGILAALPGDSVQVVAYLTDEIGGRSIPPVSVRGNQASREEAFTLLNELYRELAVASAGQGELVVSNAAFSTSNMVAFGALLDGELHLANWNTNDAVAAFERAVEADSTVALAWYRLAMLYDSFNMPPETIYAIEHAEAFSEQLSEHDRRVLSAFGLLVAGRVEEAEPIYLELLEENPDDVEALFQLGMLRWAYIWRQGRSMSEAQAPLRRVLELAPRSGNAAMRLMYSLAATSELEAMDSLATAYPDLAFGAPAATAIGALLTGDTLAFDSTLNSVGDPFSRALVASLVLLGTQHDLAPDLGGLANMIRPDAGSPNLFVRMMASSWLASLEAGRGRWREARNLLELLDSLPATPAVPWIGQYATLPVEGPPLAGGSTLATRVKQWSYPDPLPPGTGNVFTFTTAIYSDLIRLYLGGLLTSAYNDFPAARSYADSLERLQEGWFGDRGDSISVHRTLPLDLAQGIRADVLWREGKPQEALDALDRAQWELNYNEVWFSGIGGVRETFLRARLLQEVGRYQEALSLYDFGTESRVLHFALLAPAHYHRGQIYQEMGDTEKALWHYGAFVDLWRDADPEYQPMVTDAKDRIAALVGEQAAGS